MGCVPLPNTLTLLRRSTFDIAKTSAAGTGASKFTLPARISNRYPVLALAPRWGPTPPREFSPARSSASSSTCNCYCLISNRRELEKAPALPDVEIVRTRHHIVFVGSVNVVNCDETTFWLTSGAEKLLLSAIWIV